MAVLTVLPAAISSLILANVITFASTAIPIERMIPAIPGSVSVSPNASENRFKRTITITMYNARASDAHKPGIRNTAIINTTTIAKPIIPALILVEIASEPSCAPTTFDLNSSRASLSPPILMVDASCSALSASSIPVICA